MLGRHVLTLRGGPDGAILLEEHPVTEEMCAALQAERPDQAAAFEYATVMKAARQYAMFAPRGLWDVTITHPGVACPCGCGN